MQKMSLKLAITNGLIFLLTLLASKVIYGVWQKQTSSTQIFQNQTKQNKIVITTSFYPLYFFAKEIVGDKAEVVNLTKAGIEPHDFEPSTKDLQIIENSQLLLVNGALFEGWLDKFSTQLINSQVEVLRVAENLSDLQVENNGQKKTDPHIWLDPVLAIEQIKMISSKLQSIDPKNGSFYEQSGQQLIAELQELDQEFKDSLTHCQKDKIITSHAAFAYLARRYGFEQIAIQGLNPDEEPSPSKIAATTKLARELGINYIFFETLVSPKIAQTIAAEVGAKTLVFNPLEGLTPEEEMSGKNYFSIQRENLVNLSLALSCQ